MSDLFIDSIGVYTPPTSETLEEMGARLDIPDPNWHKILECESLPREEKLHPAGMALRAARDAFARSDLKPNALDTVIFGGTGLFDHFLWSPSLHVAYELEADQAKAFELMQGCASGATALELIRNEFSAYPERKVGLVCCAERLTLLVDQGLTTRHWSDGCAAVLVRSDVGRLKLGPVATRCDGTLNDISMLRSGTSTRTLAGQTDLSGMIAALSKEEEFRANENYAYYRAVVDEVLSRANLKREDLRWVVTDNDLPSFSKRVCEQLEIDESKRCTSYDRVAHIGAGDAFVTLHDLIASGKIEHGDHILVTVAGFNRTWVAFLLEGM